MLFMAEMEVRLPPNIDPEQADDLRAREREYSGALQRDAAGLICGASPAATPT